MPYRTFVHILFLIFLPLSALTDETQNPFLWQQLYQQGEELEKGGKYSEAIAKYEQSIRIAEQSNDQSGMAKNLIVIGRIRMKSGEYAEALKMIQRGKELSEQIDDQLILVSALVVISELDERQSRFPEALKSANQALQIALDLKDTISLSEAYRAVGHGYFSQGQFKNALKNYEESLKYAEETKNPSVICYSLLAAGVAILDTGDYDRGVQYLLSAFEKAEEAGERSIMASILSETGIAYKEMGMFEESAEYYNRSLRFAEEIGQKETKARILNNLGILYKNEGRNDEAIYHYQQSLKIAEELKNRRGIALILNNIGSIFHEEGRYEEALSYFERSLKTREEIGDQWGIASALLNMGTTFEKQKHYDMAVEVYQRSLKISEQTGNKPRVALTLRNLGETYLNQGNYERAEQNFMKALSLGKEIQSKTMIGYSLEGLGRISAKHRKYSEAAEYFRQALTLGKEVTKPEMIWSASYELAKVYEKLERHPEALKSYSEAIDEIEKVRARASSDEGKSGFLAKNLRIYEDLISLLYKLQQKYPQKHYDVQAFDYSERAKARMFLDTMAEFQSGIRKGLNNNQVRQERAILRKISKFQSEVWEASTDKELQERKKNLLDAETELDQLVLNLKFQNPQYAQLKYPEPYSLSQLKKQLHPMAVLLEFFVGESESFVFAATSEGQQIGSLPGRLQLEELVRKYLERIRMPPKVSLGNNANSLRNEYQKQALTLFHLLVAPVKQQLAGKEDLILILDGILYYLPFETLITDRNRLLMEDFRISYAPSATIWVNLKKKAKEQNTKELVAFADPLLSSERNLVRLNYTRKEVEGIASLYPQNSREVYLAEEATEEKFKKERNLDCKILHFATHALINEDVPRRSGVVLSASENGEADGVLQMHEIWNLDLNTELVVLSACQTGLGKLVRGEGMVSLMRAFFYAGTRNVVVSLWNVDDNSTADLMKQFYVHMKHGKGVAESLRLAKLDMIENAKNGSGFAAFEDPYYWSPFILVGPGE